MHGLPGVEPRDFQHFSYVQCAQSFLKNLYKEKAICYNSFSLGDCFVKTAQKLLKYNHTAIPPVDKKIKK